MWVPKWAPGKFNIHGARIWKHCPRRVYAGAREAFQALQPDRRDRRRLGQDAAELRADAKTGRSFAGAMDGLTTKGHSQR